MRISLATTVLLILLVVQVAESRRPSKAEARINKGLKNLARVAGKGIRNAGRLAGKRVQGAVNLARRGAYQLGSKGMALHGGGKKKAFQKNWG